MRSFLLFIILTSSVNAAPYLQLGLGIPLLPEHGYTPDMYGILGFGYKHSLDNIVTLDASFKHRSLTSSDNDRCGDDGDCLGDNSIEFNVIFEFK